MNDDVRPPPDTVLLEPLLVFLLDYGVARQSRGRDGCSEIRQKLGLKASLRLEEAGVRDSAQSVCDDRNHYRVSSPHAMFVQRSH